MVARQAAPLSQQPCLHILPDGNDTLGPLAKHILACIQTGCPLSIHACLQKCGGVKSVVLTLVPYEPSTCIAASCAALLEAPVWSPWACPLPLST